MNKVDRVNMILDAIHNMEAKMRIAIKNEDLYQYNMAKEEWDSLQICFDKETESLLKMLNTMDLDLIEQESKRSNR